MVSIVLVLNAYQRYLIKSLCLSYNRRSGEFHLKRMESFIKKFQGEIYQTIMYYRIPERVQKPEPSLGNAVVSDFVGYKVGISF